MSLRTKLTIGLAFLFIIIFALAIYSSLNIQILSKDADKILKDNYDSLVYCKNMLLALDDIRIAVLNKILEGNVLQMSSYDLHLFDSSREIFIKNLNAEKNNITEIHEAKYVEELTSRYSSFIDISLQVNKRGEDSIVYFKEVMPAYLDARQTIAKINDLNMEAIERKNQTAKRDAEKMIIAMAAVGAICIILAFVYFWYFPFFVSNTLAFLTIKMKDLLRNVGLKIDTQAKDEAFVLLHSINLLEKKFAKKYKKK